MAPSKTKHASKACVIPGGFTVLSLQYSPDSTALHSVFVKEHRVRAEKTSQRPLDKTLFAINIPPYCSEPIVKQLFSRFGPVQLVELRDKPGSSEQQAGPKLSQYFTPAQKQGFKVGYIVFDSASSVAKAKSHPLDVPLVVSTGEQQVETGIQKWVEQYRKALIQPVKLKKITDSFLQDFDKRKEEEAERKKKEEEMQQEDEEGWTKVTRGSRGVKARPHSEMANQRSLQKETRKRKRKELINFYTWQHRNTQKEHIAELRKKFEEDKQKIALLRSQRKFRPY